MNGPPIPNPNDTSREKLYSYCDQATGQDPLCYTTQFGNNLRAAERALLAPEEFGGQTRREVDGAQGLDSVAAVGIDVDSVRSSLVGIDLATKADDSSGSCRTAFDDRAMLGVVTVMVDGPRGPSEAVQAYIIANPVFRIGRSLREAGAGLGSPGIGVLSSLADLQAAYPGMEVVEGVDGKVAMTAVEPADEQLAAVSDERQMVFWLGEDERVQQWMLGVPQYAQHFCS